jgi:DNA invertase Pin-like site-specific DNA recombinase
MKRCAIYSRVSTIMQAEVEYNSCEAQRDRILSYIKSQEDLELAKEYSDPAFSAATLERPALQELLRDIAENKIDAVLAYKIDRLTRSSKDFYNLIEFFDKHGVTFVSVSEHFDTSSASGRLLRNIMLTFAQFEREMTAERIRDKFEQIARKGLWNGNALPLGYKGVEKKLLVDGKWSLVVRGMFEKYVSTGSLMTLMKFVRSEGVTHPRSKKPISLNAVYSILRNPVYIGKIRWNENIFQGIHEPIVSEDLFNRAQELMKTKAKKPDQLFKKNYLLSGLVKCTDCGSTMTNNYTEKKTSRYYYYKCTKVMKEGPTACSVKSVNSEKLEAFLIEQLSRIAQDRQYLEGIALKWIFDSPRALGIEPTAASAQNLANRVQQVLMEFKNKVSGTTQVERCLIFQKTIERINFSRSCLEVLISLRDTNDTPSSCQGVPAAQLPAAKSREGRPDRPTLACIGGSILTTGGDGFARSNSPHDFNIRLLLPHALFDLRRFR